MWIKKMIKCTVWAYRPPRLSLTPSPLPANYILLVFHRILLVWNIDPSTAVQEQIWYRTVIKHKWVQIAALKFNLFILRIELKK